MAELQTISAAFELAKLARSACVFLKKVKDADRISAEVYERTTRLYQVLNGLRQALKAREENGIALHDHADLESSGRIRRCIEASGIILKEVEKKIGGFDNAASGPTLVEKVKIALRHPGIVRLQTDLDAGIQALQTELSILHLSDQAHTHSTIGSNHQEILETLTQLREQLTSGNKLLYTLLREHRKLSSHRSVSPHRADSAVAAEEDVDTEAIENLADCLHIAEELHERYTSEYAPDDRSIRFHRGVWSEQGRESPFPIATPVTEESGSIPLAVGSISLTHLTSTDIHDDEEGAEDSDVWPREILDMYIEEYHERANKEREQGHWTQAEVNLQSAIRYSEMRERHYGVDFVDRVKFHEEIAVLYQKQHKWAEAVNKAHQLLRESSNEWAVARQNQILASIYYDRHINRSGPALSNSKADIENAEKHAEIACKKRFKLLKLDEAAPEDEIERHNSCTELLIRILETRDKTVEANGLTRFLSADTSSTTTDSLRRRSTNRPPSDFVIVEDKHESLTNAIRNDDSDAVQRLLDDGEVDIEQMCKDHKTPLMHAVEKSNETIVHKLLGVGADVSTANKRGITALHIAASLGLHDMVRCLLHHDAEMEAKDKRGETAIMKAVQNDQETIVQILFDAGADMDTKNADEWSLLHYSIRLSKPNMINQLLDIGPDLRDSVDQAGKTALHHCADLELVDQATALLTHKNHVDVNAMDSVSRSPLYFAASKPPTPRRESMVRLLVDHGASVDESRPPPRYRDYNALKPFQVPRRASRVTRMDSMDTTVTTDTRFSTGTASTGLSRLSRLVPRRRQ